MLKKIILVSNSFLTYQHKFILKIELIFIYLLKVNIRFLQGYRNINITSK